MNLTSSNWTAIHTHDHCVQITLGEDINLSLCRLKIISAERIFVEEETINNRNFEICLETEFPLFAELTQEGYGPCIKYIEKTGDKFYSSLVSGIEIHS